MNRIRYLILVIAGTLIPFFQSTAQIIETEIDLEADMEVDVLPYDSIIGFLPESMDVDMQKLLEGWHASFFFNPEEHCETSDINPIFSDTIYRMRMNRMMTVVPMMYNETIRKCIDRYAIRLRKQLRYIMGMADFYFPMMEQILDAHNLPLELKYLSIIESALNPVALSRVGASGLWQFMLPTGKSHGLEINSLIDERLDPEKATEAACKYLQSLYNRYDDWHLAIAAYNCGEGGVNKAIARSGGKMDFWKIINYLPRETRSYVPLFIAVTYIMTYHCDHNICPVRSNFVVATDTIMVERALHFDQIADILQIDKEAIRFYNPQYKREIIPGNIQPSVLRLPIESLFSLIDIGDSVYTHRIEELFANCAPVDANVPDSRKERITHTVKVNETVYTVANLYGVTAQNLRKWNSVAGTRLPLGKKLTIYIDNGGLTYSSTITTTTASATTASAPKKPESATASTTSNSGNMTYKVQEGDTLIDIAKKYPGVTWQSIQQANGMSTTNLKIGQILKIPKG